MADKGKTDKFIFDQYLDNYYYSKVNSKRSLDTNDFDISFAKGLSLENGTTTVTNLTVELLSKKVGKYDIFVCGGGRKNKFLIDSLRNKILPLDDDIIVYPAHGAGSSCGKNLSKETFSTLGIQKKTNYALKENISKQKFISELLDGMPTPPRYFKENAMMNKQGYNSFDDVIRPVSYTHLTLPTKRIV